MRTIFALASARLRALAGLPLRRSEQEAVLKLDPQGLSLEKKDLAGRPAEDDPSKTLRLKLRYRGTRVWE